MSNELHEILNLYLPKNFPNRGALERRINAAYTHNNVVEQRCFEARIEEWSHIDADGGGMASPYYWYNDEDGKYHEIRPKERVGQLKAQLTNLQNKEEK